MTGPPLVLLFVPGQRPGMVEKARALDVDAVVFDLEDSVPPAQKSDARRHVRQALASWDAAYPRPFVRVNPPRAGAIAEDAAVLDGHPDVGVVIPKVDRALEIEIAGEPLALLERQVIVTVETARAFFHLEELADHILVDGLCLGGEDLAFGMGMQRTASAAEFDVPRFLLVAAARAAGIHVFDSICPEFRDLDVVRIDAQRGAAAGMDGKFAIHPAQVPVLDAVFRPSPEALEHAERVVAAYDAAVARGEGAVAVDGQMIDPPVAERLRSSVLRGRRAAGSV